MLQEKLHSTLVAGVPMVAKRVYPLLMPQDTKADALVYGIQGDTEKAGLCGVAYASDIAIQIDVFAKTYAQSILIKDEVIAAIRSDFKVANVTSWEMYEDITLKYRQIISFRLLSYDDK